MRIGLLVGSTLHPLAGEEGVSERDHSSAADVRITAQIIEQPLARIRAAAAQHPDRGNLSATITFSTTRRFASVPAAEKWAAAHDISAPRKGTLRLDSPAADGSIERVTWTDAIVLPPDRELLGATIRLAYTCRGVPATSATIPAPDPP